MQKNIQTLRMYQQTHKTHPRLPARAARPFPGRRPRGHDEARGWRARSRASKGGGRRPRSLDAALEHELGQGRPLQPLLRGAEQPSHPRHRRGEGQPQGGSPLGTPRAHPTRPGPQGAFGNTQSIPGGPSGGLCHVCGWCVCECVCTWAQWESACQPVSTCVATSSAGSGPSHVHSLSRPEWKPRSGPPFRLSPPSQKVSLGAQTSLGQGSSPPSRCLPPGPPTPPRRALPTASLSGHHFTPRP